MKKRLFSILTALALCLTLLPTAALAAENVSYLDATGASQTCTSATEVTANDTTWNTGWYVAQGDVTISGSVTFSDDVHLILTDGCSLTVNGGIEGSGNLTIYGQTIPVLDSEGRVTNNVGTLTAKGGDVTGDYGKSCGINANGGNITINGGTVNATGGNMTGNSDVSCGINADGGSLTISGGIVNATGGDLTDDFNASCGINADGNLTISGGTVTATGGSGYFSHGVYTDASGSPITISGDAVVIASGGKAEYMSAGIRAENSTLIISGTAEVTATGGEASDNHGIYASGGNLTISGTAEVTATATGGEASERNYGIYASGGNLTISGTAEVTATATGGASNTSAMNKAPTLGSGMKVSTGRDGIFTPVEYYSLEEFIYTSSPAVKVEPCTAHALGDDWVFADEDTHSQNCKWCGPVNWEQHAFDANGVCTACGIWKVSYLDADGATKTHTAAPMTAAITVWSEGWYVAQGDVTISGTVALNGDVHLILADGCDLTVNGSAEGMGIGGIGNLTVYSQSTGDQMGSLTVTAAPYWSSSGIFLWGNITVNGGNITARGGDADGSTTGYANSFGIYAGHFLGGNITVNGGNIIAVGGPVNSVQACSAGIWTETDMTINGGTVIARTLADESTTMRMALNVAPNLTGYSGYYWRTSPENSFELSTDRGYGYSGTDTYVEFSNGYTYTITLDSNDNGGESSTVTTGTEGKLTSLPTPTRSGYTFDGWFTAATGGTEVTTETVFNANTTIYAHWTVIPSSGGSSNTTTKTEKNPDGSTTTTVTDKTTGTVTETTKTADGTTGTVVTDSSGEVTEVKVSVSSAAVTEAAKTGETVKLPMEVPAAKTTEAAPAVEVTVPKSAGEVKVEIPVEKVTPGTVAVIVHADGAEEIVSASIPTETGVVLTLDGSATVKIVDNAKVFEDIHSVNHWAEEAVDFVVARGMFAGTSETTFSPNSYMTCAMLMTVLARFDGEDTSGGSVWYEKGIEWAKANGVSDGSNPDAPITREQLATMLWRYAGSLTSSHSLDGYTDADEISGYALEAMGWANENGIINGYGNGLLGVKDNATRAQVAQMLMNFVKCLNQ